jgi:hypothetical protein
MARYQVKLFKNILSSDGHPFRCLQSTTDVEADGPERAVNRVLEDMRGRARDWEISVSLLASRKPQRNQGREQSSL